jgi:hypothetical protein
MMAVRRLGSAMAVVLAAAASAGAPAQPTNTGKSAHPPVAVEAAGRAGLRSDAWIGPRAVKSALKRTRTAPPAQR